MEPSVAVVILNWNGLSFLSRFLQTVVDSKYSNLQVVVGDNASTDGSVAYIRSNFPQIQIIENGHNYGFAEGYNRVLKLIVADYYVLLNSDVSVTENWIHPVIALMESDPSIAAAQPKIKWFDNPEKFEYAGAAGGFMDRFGFPFCRGRIFDVNETDHGQYDDAVEVFWASGAALFVKRKCWEEVGGLDPDLFAHMEEIDVCWRLKNLGYRIAFCPDAEVYHVGGGTLNAENPFKTYLNFRNNLYILQKNLPFSEACLIIFLRFWIDFIALLHFAARGEFKHAIAVSKAHFSFLYNIFRTAKKRTGHQKPYLQHAGVYAGSIVWSFFYDRIKTFTELNNRRIKRLKMLQ
jgi:GT2 family glycosyltransferase